MSVFSKKLIGSGSNSHMSSSSILDSSPQIHKLASGHAKKLTKFLSTKGTDDVNVKDSKGSTPLHIAVFSNSFECVQILLEHDAVVNARDGVGNTPLYYAVYYGFRNILEILLSHNAVVRATSKNDVTPVHWASGNGNLDILVLLLAKIPKNDKYINHISDTGSTPLHWAASHGFPDVCSLLLEWGANPTITNSDGETPIAVALRRQNPEVIKVLEPYIQEIQKQRADEQTRLQQEAKNRILQTDIFLWNDQDVALFISSILNYPQYANIFLENNVTGPLLLHINLGILGQIGIRSLGHRETILKSIQKHPCLRVTDISTMEFEAEPLQIFMRVASDQPLSPQEQKYFASFLSSHTVNENAAYRQKALQIIGLVTSGPEISQSPSKTLTPNSSSTGLNSSGLHNHTLEQLTELENETMQSISTAIQTLQMIERERTMRTFSANKT